MGIADDVVAQLEPWHTDELEQYVRSVLAPSAQVELLALDDEEGEHEGWTILLDADRLPAEYLPWLAQFVGERLPKGLEVQDPPLAREWLKDQPNSRRGSVESVVRVAQRTLTGSRTVTLHEREPDEDTLFVTTLTGETPDPAVVERDLRADAVPGDIVLTYNTITGQTYADLDAHAGADTYTEMEATWPDYNAVLAEAPGGTTYTRPRP